MWDVSPSPLPTSATAPGPRVREVHCQKGEGFGQIPKKWGRAEVSLEVLCASAVPGWSYLEVSERCQLYGVPSALCMDIEIVLLRTYCWYCETKHEFAWYLLRREQ